jgi:arylsulfatase A-like enzyme
MRENLSTGLSIGMCTGLAVACIDTVDTLSGPFTGQSWALAGYLLALYVFAGGLLGLAAAAWLTLSQRAGSRLPGPASTWFKLGFTGAPWAAFVCWVPLSWIEEHWPGLSNSGKTLAIAVYPILCLATLLAAWVAYRWHTYSTKHPEQRAAQLAMAAAGALLAALAYAADRRLYVNLYRDFHIGLSGVFAAAIAICVASLRFAWRQRARRSQPSSAVLRRLPAGALALACLSLVTFELAEPDIFGPSRSAVFSKVRRAVLVVTDWDSDGVSSFMGGADCGPFDARVAPGNFDMPGNQLDEDCSGTKAEWPNPRKSSNYRVPDLSRRSVLMITIDALRADHLGVYGYKRNTSPNIDQLASESIRFAEAFAPAPKTYETFPALMSGLYPSNVARDYRHPILKKHGKLGKSWYHVTDQVQLLAPALKKKKYRTAAFVKGRAMELLGLDRGFETFKQTAGVTLFARRYLRKMAKTPGQPFFLWLHYYGPHEPYERHSNHDFGPLPIDRYDSEIKTDDQQVAGVLSLLQELDLAQNTLVILTADHGEEFGDHGGKFHSLRLYRELLHVPLLVKVPGIKPQVVETPVELVDVVPTLCEVLKLHASCDRYDGQSLLAAVANQRDPKRGAYAELFQRGGAFLRRSLYDGRWRLIQDIEHGRNELYDLDADPTERHDVSADHPAEVGQLLDRIATRPLYQQGRILSRYLDTGDRDALVKNLDVLRREELVGFALDALKGHLRTGYAPQFDRLSRAYDVPEDIRQRAKRFYWLSRAAH